MLPEPVRVAGNDVTPGMQALENVPYAEGLQVTLGTKTIEAYSRDTTPLIPLERGGSLHGFITAAQAAYAGHYPLVLSPDTIWLLIAQGFARHVNENAERLRHRFVAHEGQIDLTASRADLMLGFAGNAPLPFFRFASLREGQGARCGFDTSLTVSVCGL